MTKQTTSGWENVALGKYKVKFLEKDIFLSFPSHRLLCYITNIYIALTAYTLDLPQNSIVCCLREIVDEVAGLSFKKAIDDDCERAGERLFQSRAVAAGNACSIVDPSSSVYITRNWP